MQKSFGAHFDGVRSLALLLGPALLLWGCEPATPEPGPGPREADASEPGGGGAGGRGRAAAGGATPEGGRAGTGGAASGATSEGGRAGTGGAASGAGGRSGSGSGGAAPVDAGAGSPATDASAPPRDARSPLDGASAPSAALDQRCTVPVTFRNPAMGTEGGMVFQASIPDVTAAMQAHARAICRILYRKPEEVKNVSQQGLTVETRTGVAFAAGSNITFSATYIASFARGKSKAVIDDEMNGVLVHEGTHVWQYTNGGGALVEAVADYVRYKAGFYTLARRRPGGNWNQPYTTGGFFIAWMEERYDPDLGYKLNMGMKERGFSYPAFVQQITGKPVDTVWAEYQAAIR